jgi:TPP-dependent pyruvate/acetoin dehydrogenase alpha subunit
MVGLYKLPVLYVLENNQFAMGTSLQRSTGQQDFVLKARAHGIAGEKVDAMDVLNVLKVAQRVIDRMRETGEPYFLEMECQRFVGHGIGDDNTKAWTTYRTQAQIDEARKRDPIVLLYNNLSERGLLTDAEAERLDKEVAAEIEEAIAFAEASPEPPLDSLYENVFS